MFGVIWSGATTGSDLLLLIAAIVAGLAAVLDLVGDSVQASLLPVAVCLLCLGLMAI